MRTRGILGRRPLRRGAERPVAGLLLAVALSAAGCGGTVQVEIRVLGDEEDCTRDFGASTAAAKIETYLAASAALSREASGLHDAVSAHCAAGLLAAGQPEDAEAPCEALARWVASERDALATPPRVVPPVLDCRGEQEEFAACVSRCEVRYRPDDVQVVVDDAGLLTAPQASPRCRASCETLQAISESCGPVPAVLLPETVASEDAARVERLRVVLGHVVEALHAGARATRVSLAARRLIAIAPVLPEAAATVSVRAVSRASGEVETASAHFDAVVAATRALSDAVPR